MDRNPYASPQSEIDPPREPDSGKVWVQIDHRWVRRVKSPVHLFVQALTGVALTFAPMALFSAGRMKILEPYQWPIAGVCFTVIFLVPSWYMWLSRDVLKQLHEMRVDQT